jgi:hypothetical protein
MSDKENLAKALEHYELATTHLLVALNLLTKLEILQLHDCTKLRELGTGAAGFLRWTQPKLAQLERAGCFQMPAEAMRILAEQDPQTYAQAKASLRKRN